MRYSNEAKKYFWRCLGEYRQAIESGNKERIIYWSVRIHAALGAVPKSYAAYVNRVFKGSI